MWPAVIGDITSQRKDHIAEAFTIMVMGFEELLHESKRQDARWLPRLSIKAAVDLATHTARRESNNVDSQCDSYRTTSVLICDFNGSTFFPRLDMPTLAPKEAPVKGTYVLQCARRENLRIDFSCEKQILERPV
jgi:hypothetical protein